MFSTDDTIVAVATPPGRAGLGVVRVAGPQAVSIAAVLAPGPALAARLATVRRLAAPLEDGASVAGGAAIDQVVLTWFAAPASYTGDDVVEISAHGSPVLLDRIVRSAMAAGARLAAPGEFTLRAFLNGKLDLVQAEAVADLIDAVTPAQARLAFDQLDGTLSHALAAIGEALFDVRVRLEASLDFPDEGYHFVEPGAVARECEAVRAQVDRAARDGASGSPAARRLPRRAGRRAERREVAAVQRAPRQQPRHRHAGRRHDPRSADGALRHRRARGHADRHRGRARERRAHRAGRHRTGAAGRGGRGRLRPRARSIATAPAGAARRERRRHGDRREQERPAGCVERR